MTSQESPGGNKVELSKPAPPPARPEPETTKLHRIKIVFLRTFPRIMATETESIGPFHPTELWEVPQAIAKIFLAKKIAERLT